MVNFDAAYSFHYDRIMIILLLIKKDNARNLPAMLDYITIIRYNRLYHNAH